MKRKQLKTRDRREMHEKMNGHCAYCGTPIDITEMQIDHVEPLYRGGKDERRNMLPACRSCNHYKSTMTVDEFREAISRYHKVMMRDSVTYRNAVRFGQVRQTNEPVRFYFEAKEADHEQPDDRAGSGGD